MTATDLFSSVIRGDAPDSHLQYYAADSFPLIRPVHWLESHFAVGGWSPLQRLSGMLTAHMTQIAPHNGFTWHPHRGLEIFTYVVQGELYHEDTTGGKGVIRAGEVQRMFSGRFIQHQELNRTDDFTRVIQIWFIADTQYMHLPAHYEQVSLSDMGSYLVGDGRVSEIIGPAGATDHHVRARLTTTALGPGGRTQVELPEEGESLFLYLVDGNGAIDLPQGRKSFGLYDVVLAGPAAEAPTIHANGEPLRFLSFYLPTFLPN